ncbi:MAG: polyphenol oxidase family protein [Thermoleophilaceae bacterium]
MIELALPGARVAFTTRAGGVSEGAYSSLNLGMQTGDDPARVTRNRELLADAVGLEGRQIATGHQVHGAELAEWRAPPRAGGFAGQRGDDVRPVDGHVTESPGLGLLVLVADCLPVALATERRVAILHCGWRGLAAGIVERGVAAFGEPPVAAVGPGIGRCCYEVGADVLGAFAGIEGAGGDGMLDLRVVAEAKLRAAGVERVEHVDLCTSCRADLFFSHRRDAGVTGRQAAIIERVA